MNNLNSMLLLLLNTLCIHGMDNNKETMSSLNKSSEKITTQPIPIPSIANSPKKSTKKSSMIHIELSPSSHLWLLGNHDSRFPEKRSPGNSLR